MRRLKVYSVQLSSPIFTGTVFALNILLAISIQQPLWLGLDSGL